MAKIEKHAQYQNLAQLLHYFLSDAYPMKTAIPNNENELFSAVAGMRQRKVVSFRFFHYAIIVWLLTVSGIALLLLPLFILLWLADHALGFFHFMR